MPNLTQFFLSSSSAVVKLDLFEIFHPDFSKTYRIVRNAIAGVTVTLEDASVKTFDYYPIRLTPTGSNNDLDQTLELTFGDLGDLLPQELDRIVRAHNLPFYGGALIGAFTDSTGLIIDTPFLIGNGGWFYVPGIATKLTMGIVDDTLYSDNTGNFVVNINGTNVNVGATAKPWDTTVNTKYPFVATGAGAPTVVAVTPGDLLNIAVSGLVRLGSGHTPSDGLGEFLGGIPTSTPGTYIPIDPPPGSKTKPILTYRSYRSDDLTAPLDGPFIFGIDNVAFRKEGATLQCTASRLNQGATGEIYTMDRFPMLRGFL